MRKILFLILLLLLAGPALADSQSGSVSIDAEVPDDGSGIILPVSGCTDPAATNYNPSATVDNGSCVYANQGCTDPLANNYDATAVVDDGSCTYDVSGCTDPLANNYDATAVVDDGSCTYDVSGCTDQTAINYNSGASVDDGSCVYRVFGCTDPIALNYNPSANRDNGSCVYSSEVVIDDEDDDSSIDGGIISNAESPDYHFYVNNRSLQVFPHDNQIDVLSGYSLSIVVLKSLLPKPVSYISGTISGENYFLSLDNKQNTYLTNIPLPSSVGVYDLFLVAQYRDRTVSTQNIKINIEPSGFVYEDWRKKKRVSDVKINLYQKDVLIKELDAGLDGLYGLMLPNGGYTVEFKKAGYKTAYLNVDVDNNIINSPVRLRLQMALVEDIASQSKELAEKAVAQINEKVLDNPQVEEVNNYVAPSVVAVSTVNAAVAIPWWNLIYYFQYLFTEPLAWLFRKRRRSWGVVYNSITKRPIDLAVVRLYQAETKKLVRSKVTDKNGRYNFLIDAGKYYIEVKKPGFVFPTDILHDFDEDKNYIDLYHGQTIVLEQNQRGIIAANIPIDQEEVKHSDKQILRQHFWHKVRQNISILGPILAFISYLISQSWLIGVFTLVHLFLFLLFRRLAVSAKPKSWGVVFDKSTKKPVPKSVARIFSPEYNRMIEAQVTDSHGRYGFLVEDNDYYLTVDKNGFKPYKSDMINLNNKKSDEIIGYDLFLERANGAKNNDGSSVGDKSSLPKDSASGESNKPDLLEAKPEKKQSQAANNQSEVVNGVSADSAEPLPTNLPNKTNDTTELRDEADNNNGQNSENGEVVRKEDIFG